MGHGEVLKMRIRSMIYNYQSQLLNCPDDEDPAKPVLNKIIDDLVELSTAVDKYF